MPIDLKVFATNQDSICDECGEKLGHHAWITLADNKAFCLSCADLDHLVFLPAGSTDRLPDLAIDSTHKLAFAAYPEFGIVAVVNWETMQPVTAINIPNAETGGTGGGPGQLQVIVDESANHLFVYEPKARAIYIYDTANNFSLLNSVDVKAQSKAIGGADTDLFSNRLFLGTVELDPVTAQPIGKALPAGNKIFGVDSRAWDGLAITLAIFCAIFIFYSLNYRTLAIRLDSETLKLIFGIFTWTVPLDNIEDCRHDDDLPTLMKYGGAGIHFMTIRNRYRASFNFLEYPRVVIAFKRKVGLVRDISFSTRKPEDVLRLIRNAVDEQRR